jgi:hypothetical protein
MSPVYHGHEKSVQEKRDAFHDLRTSKIGNNPSADQTEVFLKANGWYSGEIAARMADWQYWKIHRSHRRLNHWESRHERGRTELELEVALKEPVSM